MKPYQKAGDIPAEDGIYDDVSEVAYHSDRDSLSSSGARLLLEPGGPAKFAGPPRVEKKEYDLGHVVHALVLGKGSDITVVKADSWRTKAAQEARNEAREAGRVPVLREMFQNAQRVAGAVWEHPLASILLEQGTPELSIYAHDPETGERLRCRPDWYRGTAIVDLKTTKDAAPQRFRKSVAEYGYFQQAAFYIDVAALAGIEVENFYFVAVETTAPYLMSVTQIDERDIELGRRLNRAAINLFARCRATKTWPALPVEIPHLGLTDWERARAEDVLITTEGALSA